MLRAIPSAASKRRAAVSYALIHPPSPPVAPVHTTPAGIVSGSAPIAVSGSYLKVGAVGVPIVALAASWSFSSSTSYTVTMGWYVRAGATWAAIAGKTATYGRGTKPALGSAIYTYTPTSDDLAASRQIQWRESAAQSTYTNTSNSIIVRIIQSPAYTPRPAPNIQQSLIVTNRAPGHSISHHATTWADPLASYGLGSMTVAGQWVKNGIPTGVTSSSYSSTADDDVLLWRETATNAMGSYVWDTAPFQVSALLQDIVATVPPAFDAMILGKPGGWRGMNVLSYKDHTFPGFYTRNPDLWCKDLVRHLTGVAVYTSFSVEMFGATLITPRHILYCQHAHPWAEGTWVVGYTPPCQVRFVTADNVTVSRIQIAQAELPSPVDLCVALLDSPVTEADGIYVCPIFPMSATIEGIARGELLVPGIGVSQGHQGSGVTPATPVSDYPAENEHMAYINQPSWGAASARGEVSRDYHDWPYSRFAYEAYPGDSGTPEFMLYQGKLWLSAISTFAAYLGSWGQGLGARIDAVNGLIEACDASAIARGKLTTATGYTVTTS